MNAPPASHESLAASAQSPATPQSPPPHPDDDPNHDHNFWRAVVYQVALRVGWIFKTESIIMPAVLDVIGGAGLLRGCLPMLNRLGQSVPPLLISDRIRRTPIKRWALVVSTLTMAICFLLLAVVWWTTGGQAGGWLPAIFLVIYGVFFAATGINQLVVNTLTGKLVQVRQRGRLALVATVVGATLAVLCAAWLLGLWLRDDLDGQSAARFDLIFAFTGGMFLLAAGIAMGFRESPDLPGPSRRSLSGLLKDSAKTLVVDPNFRRLAIIAGLFGMSLTLFPHYQRLARDRFELELSALIPWVLAQNLGAAAFSIPAGWAADKFGTRLVLRWMILVMCVAPLLSLALVHLPAAGQGWFTLVFALLGLTPVTMRIFNYYTLEICDRHDHPKYLSTMSLAMALPPVLLSPLLGALVDWISFEFVFLGATLCVGIGFWLTFGLREPRHDGDTSNQESVRS